MFSVPFDTEETMTQRPERCPSCGSYTLHLNYRNGVALCDSCDDSPLTRRTVVRDVSEFIRPERKQRRFS